MRNNVLYRNTLGEADYAIDTQNLRNNENWFYKKWPDLDYPLNELDWYRENPALDQEAENQVEDFCNAQRDHYRSLHETMKMPYPAARPFPEQKELIEACPIFLLFQKMKKAGLLHVHNVAALSLERLMTLLRSWCESAKTYPDQYPPIYVLTKKDMRKKNIALGTLLFATDGINPGCLEPLGSFLETPAKEEWLKNLLSFHSVAKMERSAYIWDEFNKIFTRTGDLFQYEKFYTLYHIWAFREMMQNGIDHVDLRSSLTAFSVLGEADGNDVRKWETEDPSLNPWYPAEKIPFLDDLKAALLKAQELEQAKEPEQKKTLSLRVILCARRDLDPSDPVSKAKLLKKVDTAIRLKQLPEYRDLIIGFDFVSEEDRGRKTAQYLEDILYANWNTGYPYEDPGYDWGEDPNHWAADNTSRNNFAQDVGFQELRTALLKPRIQLIDFYLHDGESLWASNRNMTSAVVASRRRIGHGFLLSKYPSLSDTLTEYKPCQAAGNDMQAHEPFLEVCPISNQLLRYYPDLRAHGAYVLMKMGIQCVIGTDDPQLLGNADPAYDYWEAFVGMGLPFKAVKGLLFNSFYCSRKSLGNEAGDAALVDAFNRNYWAPFITAAKRVIDETQWIVRLNEQDRLPAPDPAPVP